MKRWCNDTERKNPKYYIIRLLQCHFIYHKFHRIWPGIDRSIKMLPLISPLVYHFSVESVTFKLKDVYI